MAYRPRLASLLALVCVASCAGGEKMIRESDRPAAGATAQRWRLGLANITSLCMPKDGGPFQATASCIEINGPSSMMVGSSEQFDCRGYAIAQGAYLETVPGLARSWAYGLGPATLFVPNIASQYNTIGAVSPGATTVQCTIGSATGSRDVFVTGPPRTLQVLTIAPISRTMNRLEDFTFTPSFRDQYNELNKIVPAPSVTWTTGDATIALVSQSGVVTARERGTTWIYASAQGKRDSATVTVRGVASVNLDTYGPSVATVGQQNNTFALVTCDPGFPCPAPVWSSSNTSILTVTGIGGNPPNGVRQGVAAGTATITVCVEAVCDSELITVYNPLTVTVTGKSLVKAGQTCMWNGTASGGVAPYVYTWSMSLGAIPGAPEPSDPTIYVGSLTVAPASLYLNVRDSRGVLGAGWKNVNFTTTGPNCVF